MFCLHPAAPIIALLMLAGCGPADNDPGPGGVTVGEAKELDEAADIIEARRPPEDAFSADATGGAKDVEDTQPAPETE